MITKFVEPWVLFPGIVVVLLLFLGVLLIRMGRGPRGLLAAAELLRFRPFLRRVRAVGITLFAVSLVLYACATPVVSGILLGGLERSVPPARTADLREAQAVVVLGGGVIFDVPSERQLLLLEDLPPSVTSTSSLSAEAESRLVYGMRLAKALSLPIVVSGGRVFSDPTVPAEAVVARNLLVDLGFPPHLIHIEEESRTTTENARYTAERFGFSRVIVVTSAYHIRRGMYAFQQAGLSPIAAPAVFHTDRQSLHPVDFLPSADAFYDSALFFRETVGYWYYRLTT